MSWVAKCLFNMLTTDEKGRIEDKYGGAYYVEGTYYTQKSLGNIQILTLWGRYYILNCALSKSEIHKASLKLRNFHQILARFFPNYHNIFWTVYIPEQWEFWHQQIKTLQLTASIFFQKICPTIRLLKLSN